MFSALDFDVQRVQEVAASVPKVKISVSMTDETNQGLGKCDENRRKEIMEFIVSGRSLKK